MRAPCLTPARALLPAALLALAVLAGCGDMPEDDPGAVERVTLVAMLEPGDAGLQTVLLSRPVGLDVTPADSTTFLPGAQIVLRRIPGGEEIQLAEDAAHWRYTFDRADFPLAPGDSVVLEASGTWGGGPFQGSAGTGILSAEGLAFTRKPNDHSHGYDADTLMVYDPDLEANLSNPTAFYVDWDQGDPDYQYQLEFNAVVLDTLTGTWAPTPPDRLYWLRDDEAAAWQVGPYPDLRLPPGRRVSAQPVAWGFFVFVDSADTYVSDALRGRRMGYYDIMLRRLNGPLARFFYTTHWWIREEGFDPVEFNLRGERIQGVVGSCARTSFRVALVDDTPR
jgi:hypothetical protein